jgi:hypothetical protein
MNATALISAEHAERAAANRAAAVHAPSLLASFRHLGRDRPVSCPFCTGFEVTFAPSVSAARREPAPASWGGVGIAGAPVRGADSSPTLLHWI